MNNAESRQNPQFVNACISHFTQGEPYMDPAYAYNTVQQYLAMITPDMVNMAVKQIYGDNNLVIFYTAPEREGLAVPTEAELTAVLAAVKTAEIEAPKATVTNEPLMDTAALAGSKVKKEEAGEFGTTVWTLANGMQVIVKPTEYRKDEVMFKTVAKGGRSILADELMPSFESNIFATYLNGAGVSKFPKSQLNKMLTGKVVRVSPYIG